MREYVAELTGGFHDVRADRRDFRAYHHPDRYETSQRVAAELLAAGSNGVVHRSVRHAGGTCVACFRPHLVAGLLVAAHYEYRWRGETPPAIRRL